MQKLFAKGLAMGLMSILAACGSSTLTTQTFTSNATWVAPASTAVLETLTGQGGSGTPASTRDGYLYYELNYQMGQRRSDGVWESVSSETTGPHFREVVPADYCEPVVTSGDPEYSAYQRCYDYTTIGPSTEEVEATTGASTTGFGKTFPGGTGGAATPVTYNSVAVTPGASYPLVIPSGGSITITYYE